METKNLNILLIDNDQNILNKIKESAEERSRFKINLKCTDSTSNLIETINEFHIDLLLLNPYIDDSKGFEVYSFLKYELINIPVITIVHSDDSDTGKNTLRLGAQDFLTIEDLTSANLQHSIECSLERFNFIRPILDVEEKFHLTLKHTPIVLFKQNKDLIYTWIFSSNFQVNPENIIGKKDNELIALEDALVLTEIKKRVMESGNETRKIIKTSLYGRLHYYDLKIEPVFNITGEIEGIRGTSQDITEAKQIERNFLRAKSLLEKIFSSLSEAVFVYELNNRKIITCNPAVQRVFGYSVQEMIGKSAEMLHLTYEEFEEYKAASSDLLLKRGYYLTELKMKRKDGRIIDTEHRITLLKKSNGWDEMVVAVVNDITERKQIELALIKAKESAEKSDKLKTEFLAQMSHEIRTPINIILSHTNHLKEEFQGNLSDDLAMSFRAINKAGKRIIRTIDLILNMSEMLTGNYELRKRTIDVYLDILLNIYIEFKKLSFDKNIEMNLHKFTENTEVTGDEYSIAQIFQQLVDNAVKYTPNGKIDIRILRNNENRLFVEIEDTGIGISQEYMSKLFVPFTQEHEGYTRLFEGSGLGLALVKKYAEINNTELKVESIKDTGTKFTITFMES